MYREVMGVVRQCRCGIGGAILLMEMHGRCVLVYGCVWESLLASLCFLNAYLMLASNTDSPPFHLEPQI